ncbi:MAG: amidohydrolase family protein [Actinomycetaceae bacterium]|nr:amidohydrolase family protein [Actinomycetaceae bacterium]
MHLSGMVLWSEGGTTAWQRMGITIADGAVRGTPADACEYWIVPGLVDVHCHVGLVGHEVATAAQLLAQLQDNLHSGVTLIRDAGVIEPTNWVDSFGGAPTIIRAGRHLAKTKRYIRELPINVPSDAELPRFVLEQAQKNPWVKLVGDWIDRRQGADSVLEPLWDPGALKEAVAAAHSVGSKVMVHTFAHATIDDLLEAEVDSIEHGTGMDAEQMREAKARGIPVTPTLLQVGTFADIAQRAHKYPKYREQMLRMYERRYEQVALMADIGVTLLVGTDTAPRPVHGGIYQELAELRKAGLSTCEIIDSATWKARQFFGYSDLHEGAVPDFVAYRADPRDNLDVLQTPALVVSGHVTFAAK